MSLVEFLNFHQNWHFHEHPHFCVDASTMVAMLVKVHPASYHEFVEVHHPNRKKHVAPHPKIPKDSNSTKLLWLGAHVSELPSCWAQPGPAGWDVGRWLLR